MIKQQGSSAVWGGQTKASGRYQQRQTQQVVQNQNRARTSTDFVGGRNGRPLGLSPSAWPPLQQAQQQQQQPPQNLHNGSAMRAVFLANPGGKRESAGTGVFLPRRVDSPSDTRRRPGPNSLSLLFNSRVLLVSNLFIALYFIFIRSGYGFKYRYFTDYFGEIFTGCSTVLVPARVVQALNLNVEDIMGGQPQQVQSRFSANCTPDTGIWVAPISSMFYS